MSGNNNDKKASKSWFACFAQATANAAGSAPAFGLAMLVIVLWAVTGPLFHFSDVWQLVINTGTTIVTFLMVFLVQNAQNRDGKIIQLKLDELIRAVENANNAYVNMESMSEQELEALRQEYIALAEQAAQTRSSKAAGTKPPATHATREAGDSARRANTPRRAAASKSRTKDARSALGKA